MSLYCSHAECRLQALDNLTVLAAATGKSLIGALVIAARAPKVRCTHVPRKGLDGRNGDVPLPPRRKA